MASTTTLERKILSISPKRQITIPQKFYKALGFDSEAECIVRNNELIIRPVRIISQEDFSEQILEELIDQGYEGKELLKAFKKQQKKIRPAIEAMLADAKDAANGSVESFTIEDVFEEDSL